MWIKILVLFCVLLAIDGLILTFYPSRIRRILHRLTNDELPDFLQGEKIRLIGFLEMVLGLSILFYLYLTKT